MRLFKLSKIALLYRNNAAAFLNGLSSNEVTKPHNAFLNLHGRIIATFDQLKIDDDTMLVVLESEFADKTSEHLTRYFKVSGIIVEELRKKVYFDLDGDATVEKDDYVILQRKGRLLITARPLESNVSPDEFMLFRVKNNIPAHGIDYKDEMLLNVDTKDYVSFTKGCFLGQEPIAKVYNRSKPSWKLVVKPESECSAEEKKKMTSKVVDPETKKPVGFVFVAN